MEELKFDDETLGLWNFVSGENNYEGNMERFVVLRLLSVDKHSKIILYAFHFICKLML